MAIVGSRNWSDFEMIKAYVDSLNDTDTVVTGGARGVDQTAEIYARARGLPVLVFQADWDKLGKRAGMIRNRDIVAKSDRLVAFWDGISTGTQHSVSLARAAGKPCLVLRASDPGTTPE